MDAPGGAVGLKGCELDGAIGGLVADNAHGFTRCLKVEMMGFYFPAV